MNRPIDGDVTQGGDSSGITQGDGGSVLVGGYGDSLEEKGI